MSAPAWRRSARWVGHGQGRALAASWLIALLVFTVAVLSNAATLEEQASVAQYLVDVVPWFLVGGAVVRVTSRFRLHVTGGMTRRSFVGANAVVGAALAVVCALLTVAALAAEGELFAARGWPHLAGDATSFDPGTHPLVVLGAVVPAFFAADLAGTLAGLLLYRVGRARDAALVPLALLPVVVVTLGAGPVGRWQPLLFDHLHLGGVTAVALVLAAGLAGADALARRTAVRAAL